MVASFLILAQALAHPVDLPPASGRLELASLVEQARTLPPEFRSDTLLRIERSGMVNPVASRMELLNDAYGAAARAPLPYLQRADGWSNSVDTNSVRPNGLEVLTLEVRAIRQFLSINKTEAVEIFRETRFSLQESSCSTPFTPDLSSYYQLSGELYLGAFNEAQRKRGEDVDFLNDIVSRVESPVEVPQILHLLSVLKLRPQQRLELLSLISGRLQLLSRSDREYGAAEKELASSIESISLSSSEKAVLLPSLRAYIIRHTHAGRCSDNLPKAGSLAPSVTAFNKLVSNVDPSQSEVRMIAAEEASPARDLGTYKRMLINSEQSQELNEALQWLTHGNRVRDGQTVPWTARERNSEAWRIRFQDADRLIQNLQGTEEQSPDAFFCLKADALNLMATLAPPGLRDRAMDEYLEFMEQNYSSASSSNLWFTMFRHILYTARFSQYPEERDWILKRLMKSKNPIISCYARLELLIGPPEESIPHTRGTARPK